ncbi:MAG: NapC/NirT family cytochrome c [Paracoccaceae bacterium]
MRLRLTVTWTTIAVISVVGAIALAGLFVAEEHYTSKSEFCGGICHTMTEQNTAWQNSKHHASNSQDGTQAECIECHFLPGEKKGFKAKMEGLRHLAAYLYDPDAPLPIRPDIKDGACLRSGCHDIGTLAEKDIRFTEKVRFKHGPHFGDKALEGQKLTCDTCHFKVTAEKHFEVPKEICYLCHLNPHDPVPVKPAESDGVPAITSASFASRPSIDFNEGASKCATCHEIPTKSLQSQLDSADPDRKPITHQTLAEAGVACESCHFQVARGHGDVKAGDLTTGGCLSCHNRNEEFFATAGDETLMHDKHVVPRTADCFDCHEVIEHGPPVDHLSAASQDCALCHQDQHSYQRILLEGIPVTDGIRSTPNLMAAVNTGCGGCHMKETLSKGHLVRTGSAKACVACHTPNHEKILFDWREQLEEEVAAAEEIAQEATEALEVARQNGAAEKTLLEVQKMIAAGQKFLEIVRVGNGVHNKKYAITILDEAFVNFEDAIDLLDGGG